MANEWTNESEFRAGQAVVPDLRAPRQVGEELAALLGKRTETGEGKGNGHRPPNAAVPFGREVKEIWRQISDCDKGDD